VYCLKDEEDDIPFDGDNIHYLTGNMDWVRELTQHEFAREFLEYFPKFNDADFSAQDELHDEMGEFLEIWREVWPHESNFVMADVIVNVLTLDPEDLQENYLDSITREGATDKVSYDRLHEILEDVLEFVVIPAKTFKSLDELIHSDKDTVKLAFDVCLDEDEAADYEDGIKIDVDGLTLDGQGHVIDADNRATIFKIDAKNVTIRNVVFKNAFSHMGGAVSNIGEVTFEGCSFIENVASELGGAIVNDKKMTISDCLFEGNSSGGVGGAIAATFASDLTVRKTRFIKNAVSLDIECPGEVLPDEAQGFGGAIYNNGKLDIDDAEFTDNISDRNGGAMIVLPDAKISIGSSSFANNHSKADGGAIHTMGEIDITDCEFTGNSADNNGGVFDATGMSKLKISNSRFADNTAKNANVIVNRGKLELVETLIDDEDIADEISEIDETQPALPESEEVGDDSSESDENETVEEDDEEDITSQEFPDDYDDYARKFKEYFEEMMEEEGDSKGQQLLFSLIFAIWASKFPEDANMIGAALLMASIYDDEMVKTILDDFDREEYRRRLDEYEPIDEELASWFKVMSLISMIFDNTKDSEEDDLTSEEYAEKYISLADDFQTADEDKQEELYDDMKKLVDDWKRDFPDDLNMSLAYIAVNGIYLSDERIIEMLDDLEGQSSGDEDAYERLYGDCREVLESRNINLDDYLEE
jgi:predicted outer membrane repeat protein